MRAYLCGAMDRVTDGGVGWRRHTSEWLTEHGVIVLDPTDKPIDIGPEDLEQRASRRERKLAGDYDSVARDIRTLRCVDLRMVDLADFLIVNIDVDVHACGTYEELFLANREKKPILVHVEQGKEHVPDWLLGVLPHETIFSSWGALFDYLAMVHHNSWWKDTTNRWYFFQYKLPEAAL